MLRVNQIKTTLDADENILCQKVADLLKIKTTDIAKLQIVKKSIDARKKPKIFLSFSVDVELNGSLSAKEDKIAKRFQPNQVAIVKEIKYSFPSPGNQELMHRPVVVGMGPAGLFCAYFLAKHGYAPILLERGRDVDTRTEDVKRFWESGVVDTASNVQFGEGGAGTFSDGKLNTLIKDKDGRNKEVLRVFVEHGAPERIMYDAKPHIGTDVLTKVVKNMREKILEMGGSVYFETEMKKPVTKNGKIIGVEIEDVTGVRRTLACDTVVLAIGHSARNTFETLYEQGIPMEAKAFAVGFRVEHPQKMINMSQYGMEEPGVLEPAPYKVTAQTSVGRGVYSFCMCPGGYVVNASSEKDCLAVNGMSYHDRGSSNANSAIIVAVTPADFGTTHPLAGIAFQRELERKAYKLGNGKIPVQRFGDFKEKVEGVLDVSEKTSDKLLSIGTEIECADSYSESFQPCTKGKYTWTDLTEILPKECNKAFVEGMECFGQQIEGFDRPDAILLGVESRTSSPVRIHRDESLQSEIRGLYPCGEGAGYAGGITSAAMDGMRVAEEIAKKYKAFLH